MDSRIKDIHTHNLLSTDGIISLEPRQVPAITPGRYYSIGIHPYRASEATESDWETVCRAAGREEVVMIGECGIDRTAIAPEELQERIFRRHIELSERLRKPLIIHCVRAVDRLLALRKEYRPQQAWVFHGFRGKPVTAAQLTAAGIYLSVGEKFNPASIDVIPASCLLAETDESALSIDEIANRLRHPFTEAWRLPGL